MTSSKSKTPKAPGAGRAPRSAKAPRDAKPARARRNDRTETPDPSATPASSQPHRRGRRLWIGLKWATALGIWMIIAISLVVAWYATGLPDIDGALAATRRPTVTVLAADGSELATIGDQHAGAVLLRELPPALPQAVLATEDRRFYSHFGIDPIGLARAMWTNFRAGRVVQGGSTISQQVAKNLFLTPDRTVQRKIQELILAVWLEHRFTKEQILTIYLNRVYLGAGTYGVEAAARRYFGKSARQLDTYECAMMAGLLKGPSRYNPQANPERAAKRTSQVLANMVAAGLLTEAQVAKAARQSGAVAAITGRPRVGRHFVDWVLEQVPSYVTPGDQDIRVLTTLDPTLQADAEARLAASLAGAGAKAGVSEAALVALDPDGAVRAMVGGRDHGQSQFNRATQGMRQPGSAFKPIVFLAGLEAGLTPDSVFDDSPIAIDGWSPRNFSGRYQGEMTLLRALADSVNTVAVRVGEYSGRERVIATARRLGLTSAMEPTPSLALGVSEVDLLQLTTSYAPFANGGIGVWSHGIVAITDAKGRVLYRRDGSGVGQVVEPAHVAAMNALLSEVIHSGTGKAATLDRPAAGKTGTSQSYRDAWFIGYSADLVVGVWFGNDDGSSMKTVTGGGLPAKLWRDVMLSAHKGRSARPLPGPTGAPSVAGGAVAGEPKEDFWGALKGILGG